jgi:hypothetical protein
MGSFPLACSTTWLSLIAVSFMLGATHQGEPWTAGLDAAARARRAEHEADGGVVSVQQALHVSPNAPPIHAQRVARFGHYCTRNCLPPKKLHRDIQ